MSSPDDRKAQLRAEISEEVIRNGNQVTMTQTIEIMIEHHIDIIRALKYDDALAQNQSTADTLVCREFKADLGEGSGTTGDRPVHYHPSDSRSRFNNVKTPAMFHNKEKETSEPQSVALNKKESNKITKVPAKGKTKAEKEFEDCIIARAKASLDSMFDLGSARISVRYSGSKSPDGYTDSLS